MKGFVDLRVISFRDLFDCVIHTNLIQSVYYEYHFINRGSIVINTIVKAIIKTIIVRNIFFILDFFIISTNQQILSQIYK